jgi:hypothetical protein
VNPDDGDETERLDAGAPDFFESGIGRPALPRKSSVPIPEGAGLLWLPIPPPDVGKPGSGKELVLMAGRLIPAGSKNNPLRMAFAP